MKTGDLVSVTIGAPIPLLALPFRSNITLTGEMQPNEVGLIVDIRTPDYWQDTAEIKVLSSAGNVGWANSLNFGRVSP